MITDEPMLTLLYKCIALHEAKDSDYAGKEPYGNFMGSGRFGVRPDLGVMVRLSDKFTRITTILAKEDRGEAPAVAETIEDTLSDLLNYAGILVVVRNRLCLKGVLPYRADPTLTFARFLLRRLNVEIIASDMLYVELGAAFDNLCKMLVEEAQGMGRAPVEVPCSRIVNVAAQMILERER